MVNPKIPRGSKISVAMVVIAVKKLLNPRMLISLNTLNESADSKPSIHVDTPVMHAACIRVYCCSSTSMRTMGSAMDMDEVHAANRINVKNVALSMLPNGRFAKAIGKVSNSRPGPADGVRL